MYQERAKNGHYQGATATIKQMSRLVTPLHGPFRLCCALSVLLAAQSAEHTGTKPNVTPNVAATAREGGVLVKAASLDAYQADSAVVQIWAGQPAHYLQGRSDPLVDCLLSTHQALKEVGMGNIVHVVLMSDAAKHRQGHVFGDVEMARLQEAGIVLAASAHVEFLRSDLRHEDRRYPMYHYDAKFTLWGLTQFRQVLFLDTDVVVLKDLRPLFGKLGTGSGVLMAPDVATGYCWNSGVMVLRPNQTDHDRIQARLLQSGPLSVCTKHDTGRPWGDQDFLQDYFVSDGRFAGMPSIYNVQLVVGKRAMGLHPGKMLDQSQDKYRWNYINFMLGSALKRSLVGAVHFGFPKPSEWMGTNKHGVAKTVRAFFSERPPTNCGACVAYLALASLLTERLKTLAGGQPATPSLEELFARHNATLNAEAAADGGTGSTPEMCKPWGCECQAFSNKFGTRHGSWGSRVQHSEQAKELKTWWLQHSCTTAPESKARWI